MEDTVTIPSYVVLGFGENGQPEEILVLVQESERQGIPFHWLTRDLPSYVTKMKKEGKKDPDIARALGYMAGGDCKFGFYLGMADVDTHFYLSASFCYSFLQEYGPGSTREKIIEGKTVKFLICSKVNFDEIRKGEAPVYTLSRKNSEGKPRPFQLTDYKEDEFYTLYLSTLVSK